MGNIWGTLRGKEATRAMKVEKSITMQDGTKVTVRIEADNAEDFPILRDSTLEASAKALVKFADIMRGSGKGSEGRG